MSRLPKAPLIEVIFELRWTLSGKELQDAQYLHGDLYPKLKDKFPFREIVQSGIPVEFAMQLPTHRFRSDAGGYPLVQVGAGILTVNTTDPKYFWGEYENLILEVLENFYSVYSFPPSKKVTTVLQYIDFLKFDFKNDDIIKFLDENLNLSVSQTFYKSDSGAKNMTLVLHFENALGLLVFTLGSGKNSGGQDGIIIQTSITRNNSESDTGSIKDWLDEAHKLCSNMFKDMTRGKLYSTFE